MYIESCIMYHRIRINLKKPFFQLNSSNIFILTDFFVGLKSHLKSYSTQKDITWKLLYEAQESSSNIKVPKSLLTDRQNIHIMQKPNLQVTWLLIRFSIKFNYSCDKSLCPLKRVRLSWRYISFLVYEQDKKFWQKNVSGFEYAGVVNTPGLHRVLNMPEWFYFYISSLAFLVHLNAWSLISAFTWKKKI